MSWKKPPVGLPLQDGCTESSLAWKQPGAGAQLVSGWKKPAAGNEEQIIMEPSKKRKTSDSGQTSWKKCGDSSSPLSSVTSSASWKKPSLGESEVAVTATAKAGKTVRHHVSLDVPMLSLVASSDDGEERQMTEYKKKALDPDRIAKVLLGSCSCKNNCFGCFKAAKVLEVCQLWHSMTDEAQHHFLNAQWESSAENHCWDTDAEQLAHRTTWYFEGQQICLPALCTLLGVGNKAMAKKLQGVVDQRRRISHGEPISTKPALQRNFTSMFFLELYHQSAEDLPETLHVQHVDENISASLGENDCDAPTYLHQISTESEIFSWTPEAAIVQNIMTLCTVDLSTVPVRHLPPGKLMSLFWQFQAWCEAVQGLAGQAIKRPSWSTFWRLWWEKWSSVLKFRKVSQHKECDTCHKLREKLHGSLA